MITEKNSILKITALKPEQGVKISLKTELPMTHIRWRVQDVSGETLISREEMESVEISGYSENHCCCESAKSIDKGSDSAYLYAKFPAEQWAAEHPVLYQFAAEVTFTDGTTEHIEDRFGFRYFSCDEKNIYLNGYPFYMRAYIRGCAAHEHENNCNLSEYEFYKKNILMAKGYGFNTVRFHSVIPPQSCFRAADELGMLIHIEMRAEKQEYDNLEEMLYGKNDFVSDRELLEIIHTLYNHPSFMVYCVGNEIREPGKKPRIKAIRDLIKEHDSTRLFLDTCAHGEYDRDYVDFDVQHMGYFFPYGRNAEMFANTDNLLCFGSVKDREMVKEGEGSKIRRAIHFSRPLIAHEVCHYTSWRDFYALKEKFEKYNHPLPWWVEEEIKMIEAKGYRENFKETLQITKDYQFRCWKTALEGIRASHILSGFHMLQFADTDRYENSNGVVDCFDDPHGISAEEFRKFNADTVVLARLPKQIYAGGEQVKVPVLLSQYRINPAQSGVFTYRVEAREENGDGMHKSSFGTGPDGAENTIILQGALEDVATGESGLYDICSLELTMPRTEQARKLVLTCEMQFEDGTGCENSWELWVFPELCEAEYHTRTLDAVSDMQCTYLDTFRFKEDSSLIITDKLDDSMFDRLEEGKDVLLIYRQDWTRHLLHKDMSVPQYAFRAVWERYKGVIWDRGHINGGPDRKEILNRYGFVTDGQINFQYYPLIEDCDKLNLDDFPAEAESIVSGLDKSSRDRFDPKFFGLRELMYDRTMRHFSYAFAVQVGKGRLLVTGFNFTGVEKKEPASCAMLKTLVNYMHSEDFAPKGKLTVEALKTYLSDIAAEGPQKERMMTQYWQLDDAPVESMNYWKESEAYLREK